jgi:hypothetical protein
MLVNCPKCNFSQPKDTYCANCGIEMDTYRPEKKPILKVLLKNPLFHLVIFLFASYFAYINYVQKTSDFVGTGSSNSASNQGRRAYQNVKSTLEATAANPNHQTVAADNPNGNATPKNANTNDSSLKASLKNETGRNPSTSETANSDGSSGNQVSSWTLNVRYIELSNQAYQQWVNEAQGIDAYAEMGEFVMGKITRGKNLGRSIDSANKDFKDLKTNRLFAGNLNTDSAGDQNINFKYNLTQDSSGAFQGEFEINEEDSVGANKKQFNSSFEMKSSEILFIKSAANHNPGKTETNESEYLILFDFQSRH